MAAGERVGGGEAWFYHLERADIERALPLLVEKCLARGWRVLIRGALPERLELLDQALWTYRDDSFIPHAREGQMSAARQPVLLTDQLGNPNGAAALVCVDGAEVGDCAAFSRALVVFDGRDAAAVARAREQWAGLKAKGATLAYWKDTQNGWERAG